MRIAILASGRGTGFEAICEAVSSRKLDAEVALLLSDQPDAPVVQKARATGIPVRVVPAETKGEAGRRAHDLAMIEAVQPFEPKFLVMAGYMRIVTPELLAPFRSPRGYARVTNIHPSLLPAFPGVRSYAQALAHGAKVAGATVHLVGEAVDDGPICAQEAFAIADCRTPGEVEARGLKVEHRLYPETLRWVLREDFEVEWRETPTSPPRRRLCVCPH